MSPISPGSLLAGRFRLEDLLEETAGARFWRATDLVLMRDVAVHVVDQGDPRAPALLAAARTSATVSVPHLLRVLDAAEEEGVVYVVNEWGNGVSLDRMLLEGPLSPRKAAWMVREVADALTAAHRVGVAHGRLIPENVMINDSGSVKLIGFVVDGVLHGRSGDHAERSERETDVHDLAGLLYAALVGKWPGIGDSTVPPAPLDHGKVLRPRQVRAGVPRPLDRICELTLGSDEASVPILTAVEIKAALTDFLGEAEEPARIERTDHPDLSEALNLPSAGDPEATEAGAPDFDDAESTWSPSPAPVPQDRQATSVVPITSTLSVPTHASSKTPYVGMGGGHAPSSWGPDDGRSDEHATADWAEDAAPGTSWLRLAALLTAGLLLLVAVVFAFNLGRGGDDETPAVAPQDPSPVAAEIELADVVDFDPFQRGGTPEENPDQVPLAHDGDPDTAWTTSTYRDGPDITVYKPGVGLLLDLGSEQRVSEVGLTLRGEPNDVRLLAAPRGSARPVDTGVLDEVAAETAAGTSVTLRPRNLTARYLVIWFVGLPAVDGGYRAEVAEIVVRS